MFNPLQMLANNPLQMLGQLQNSGNPAAMMQQMFGGNPLFQRALQMTKGKNPQQLQQTLFNLAQQRGINQQQLQQMAAQFGFKL